MNIETLRVKPAVGYMTLEATVFNEIIKERVTDAQIRTTKRRVEDQLREQVVTPQAMMMALRGQGQMPEISEAAIREILEYQQCSFESGVIVEINVPGIDPGFGPGDTVFYHEGRGHMIGQLKVIGFEAVIAYDRHD